ncbi:hypothetical protein [Pimelobacter sp. 30-1]|uniref:hypothetical protein n=1 Tax=Pimelobacter sp. 30-1 TaxID=2004991 RepID=UPI001C03D698|nr:hypothetical protein [Pimelobacter sp. 30-1]MBU2695944.1 hypothetical protein [Pimelobacter sp. 30-1]
MTDLSPSSSASSSRTDHVSGLAVMGVGTGLLAVLLYFFARQGNDVDSAETIAMAARWAWFFAGTTALLWTAAILAHAMRAHTDVLLERIDRLERVQRSEGAEGAEGAGGAER